MEYDVVRHERIALNPAPHVVAASLTKRERQEDLQSDVLVPITGLPADLATKVTEGKAQPLDKARAIYDYVFTDSAKERQFVQELDTGTDVVVYAKLPRAFAILARANSDLA